MAEEGAVTAMKAADAVADAAGRTGAALDTFGATPEAQVQGIVSSYTVAVLGESWCPFSLEAVRVCEGMRVQRLGCFMLDKLPTGAQLRAVLKDKTQHTTVPYVFVNQKFIGGCDQLKTLQYSGELTAMLGHDAVAADIEGAFGGVAQSAVATGTPPAPMTFFDFPAVADDRVIRLVGLMVAIACVLCAAFFDRVHAQWTMGGIMIDFSLRFYGGANISPIGSMAQLIAAVMERFGSKPRWIAGPPKQFASFCGIMFSFLAFLCFQLSQHVAALKYAGLAFTIGLAGAAGLEGFIGFCLGCWMFQLAIRFGLVSPAVYTVYSNSKDEQDYAWHEVNKRLGEARPAAASRTFGGISQSTVIDYRYKAKTDDMTREDFHLVKHTKLAHFGMHMGLAGLAVAWQLAADVLPGTGKAVYHTLALGAAALFAAWLALYAARARLYPQKIHKEWMCSLRSNFFGAPLLCLILFAALVAPHSLPLAKLLFWVGAPANMLLSIIKVGDWIATRKDLEHVNAAWLVLPVGNFVAALVGPSLDARWALAMAFWWAFALMLWVLLFAATFAKAIIMTDNDDRMRPLLLMWAAAPAVAGVSYIGAFGAGPADHFFVITHWMGVGLALVLLWCCVRPFFGRLPFDMSNWSAGFPSAAIAVSSLTYYSMNPGDMSYGIAVAALAASSLIHAVLLLQTLAGIVRMRGVFTPEYKWGPLSFMRLTHEAFRAAIPRLLKAAQDVAQGDNSTMARAVLCERWRLFKLMHDEHSKHEDTIIFKAFDDFFPGTAQPYHDEHEEGHRTIHSIDAELSKLASADGKAAPAIVAAALPELQQLAQGMLEHLRSEEDHMQPIGRRYVPLATHKKITAQVFQSTEAAVWYELLPWVVNHLPMRQQRVRYLKTFLWAEPERAQLIGTMLALGVDSVQWALLAAELPEIVPRGAKGWSRYH